MAKKNWFKVIRGPAGMLVIIPGLLLGVVLAGCPGTGPEPGNTDLPVKTIEWKTPTDGKGGDYQFYTNDSRYYNYYFSSRYDNTRNDNERDIFEIEVKKIGGYTNMGYGMIFAVTESTVGTKNVLEYYHVLITTDGYYRVWKSSYDSGTGENKSTYYLPNTSTGNWPYTAELKDGRTDFNKIKIVKRTGNKFTLYFNDTQVNTFTDASPLTGQKVGFYVTVGKKEDEDFPNNPVDVRFKKVK